MNCNKAGLCAQYTYSDGYLVCKITSKSYAVLCGNNLHLCEKAWNCVLLKTPHQPCNYTPAVLR